MWFCGFFCCFQGHPTRKSESSFSLAAQFLLCQQPLLIPGLFLHCVIVYYAVLIATPPHPSAHSTALHPLLCTMVGRGPWLTHTPHQPLNFVEHKVWTACLTFQSQSSLLLSLRSSACSVSFWSLLPWKRDCSLLRVETEMVVRIGQTRTILCESSGLPEPWKYLCWKLFCLILTCLFLEFMFLPVTHSTVKIKRQLPPGVFCFIYKKDNGTLLASYSSIPK